MSVNHGVIHLEMLYFPKGARLEYLKAQIS